MIILSTTFIIVTLTTIVITTCSYQMNSRKSDTNLVCMTQSNLDCISWSLKKCLNHKSGFGQHAKPNFSLVQCKAKKDQGGDKTPVSISPGVHMVPASYSLTYHVM